MSTATKLEEKIPSIEDLQFVRLKIPRLIPKELIEAVKGRTFSAEEFYKYQEEQIGNPFNFLYALIDEDKKIQGYLWAEINILDKSMFVNTFSIDKKYWGKGKAIDTAVEFLRGLTEKNACPRTFWVTTNEKFFVKHGFHRSKNILMEYKEKNLKEVV